MPRVPTVPSVPASKLTSIPPDQKIRTNGRATIKFGSWIRLYSEETLLSELSQFNLTKLSLRKLLHNLRVPTIHIGSLRFVDGYSFFLALRAVLSIGEPDFHAPGCTEVYWNRGSPSKLDMEKFRKAQKRLVADLLYTKRFNSMTLSDADLLKTARLAFSRIQDHAYRIALTRTVKEANREADLSLRKFRSPSPED